MKSPNDLPTVLSFRVDDMSCQHCVDAITRSIKTLDPDAGVEIDLAAHSVRVDSRASVGDISSAISEAGYTPQISPIGTDP